jgi:sugar phosphate isomerase/epimerase
VRYLAYVSAALFIGISTSAWAELPLDLVLARISELAPAAEVRSFGRHTLLSRRNRASVIESGLTCSVHGPFGYAGLGSTSEAERLATLDDHRRHLDASAEIGASVYVVHPDWSPGDGQRDPAVVAALEHSFASLRELQDEIGIDIVVENMPGGGSHFTHPGDLDLQGLRLALDVGHASIAGCLQEWLADLRAPLRHVHLHDNHGTRDVDDPHLPVGAGVVDATAVLAAARAAGASVVLEHDKQEDVLASLSRLRRLGLVA